jgi:thymidylate kinase
MNDEDTNLTSVSIPLESAPAILTGLLDALDREGIRWSLLRPTASLASPEGDVDILVEPSAMQRVEAALEDRGFVLMPRPGPDVHGAAYDREAGQFVWMHVQGALEIAGAVLPAETVLDQAVDEQGLQRPSDAWLLWILLLRALVDKGELAERHRPAVTELAQRWQGGPPALEALALRRRIDPEAAVAAAAAGDWPALLAQSVYRPAPAPSRLRRLVRRLRGLHGLRRRRGISVAVLGPDGAGKSSLVNGLAEDLPLPTRIQYMGLTGGQLPRADALRVPGLVFAARLAIIWLRYGRGVLQTASGGIVVFDRYTLDGAVPSGMRLSVVGRISRSVQRHVCPMPDLVLLLDASGETLHERSGEYDPAVLESWRTAFARLEGRVPALVKLDAERPAEEVRRDAEALVWQRYGELRGRSARRPG